MSASASKQLSETRESIKHEPALTHIVKRDGRKVPFESAKLLQAVLKASAATKEFDGKEAERLAQIVQDILKKVIGIRKTFVTVEQVQDTVEQVLMAAGHFQTAKAYILYRAEHTKIRNIETVIGVENDLGLTVNQLKVIEKRFLLHDAHGKAAETPAQLFTRVAQTLAAVEKKSQQKKYQQLFYEVMASLEFLPAGRTLNNAGTPQNQLASCFVLPIGDSMEDIFDSVKWTAMVHQRGGGCIAEGSKVFTSFCGLENFEVLYDRLGGRKKEKKQKENGWSIDVCKEKVYTLAFDEEKGTFEKDRILKIWRYELPAERIFSIQTAGNMTVTTSDWHPFFVFDKNGVVEKRADEIREGDLLITGNPSVISNWLFQDYQVVEEIQIDEEIGWLAGYVLGDGSFGMAKANTKNKDVYPRLRLFDGTEYALEKSREIFTKISGETYTIQKDSRSKTLCLSTTDQKIVTLFQKLTGIHGPKDATLAISSILIKSPFSVVCAVIAGLLDSDGYVSHNRSRISFNSESQELIDQISSLLNLIGIQPKVRSRKPKTAKWKMMYEAVVDGQTQLELFNQYISPYLAVQYKKERIIDHLNSVLNYSGTHSPLVFADIQPFLEKIGIKTNSKDIHKKATEISGEQFWLHRLKQGGHMSMSNMTRLLRAMLRNSVFVTSERKILEKWLYLNMSSRPVTNIVRAKVGGQFYDFSTEKYHNYLAGKHGISVVHNTGFDFTSLRPRGDVVSKSSGGFATGPVSFMKVFDTATRQVMQGGKLRGANMGILAADHPDILEFITCKTEEGEISNFNISVGASDVFMKAVEKDAEMALRNPRDGQVVQNISARMLMDQIVSLAWRTGDPGMIYWDTINANNPLRDSQGEIRATNPCGEQPLHPFDACNLGSINLAKFFVESKDQSTTKQKKNQKPENKINWDRLELVTRTAVRMLDNVITACSYPLPQIADTVKKNRRIGLGVMGWADLLLQLGVAYNSNEGVTLAEKVMGFIQRASWEESEVLAKEKGAFPRWKESWFARGYDPVTHTYKNKKSPRQFRNVAITTIAPTGTISMAAECSSGIEPVFALCYVKNVVESEGLTYVNKHFEHALKEAVGYNGVFHELIAEIAETGSAQHVDDVPTALKKVFVTAHDIDWQWHVKMQAAFQKHTDNAVSKTINMPADASLEEVRGAYLLAWKLGCKGITVYRDSSRSGQVLSVASDHASKSQDDQKTKKKEVLIQSKMTAVPLAHRKDFGSLTKKQIEEHDILQERRQTRNDETCPECGGAMQSTEGCSLCPSCGYSKCKL